MRILFFIAFSLISTHILIGQWKKGTTGNKFDGTIKYASITGNGGSWPHTKPVFYINRFNEERPNIYLTNVGYTCTSGTISIAFDGTDKVWTYPSTVDKAKEAVFIIGSDLEMSELLNMIGEKSKLYLRYSNSCGQDDYEFGLAGSQSAIDYVVGSYFDEKLEELRIMELEKKRRDSILVVVRKEREEREMEEARLEAIKLAKQLEMEKQEFIESLKDIFTIEDHNNFESEIIAKITVERKSEVIYCKKVFDSGNEVYNKEVKFFEGETYAIYNEVDGDCIRLDQITKSGKSIGTIFIPASDLTSLGDDFHLKTLVEKWSDIKSYQNQK